MNFEIKMLDLGGGGLRGCVEDRPIFSVRRRDLLVQT
jgi:hypothetical protein